MKIHIAFGGTIFDDLLPLQEFDFGTVEDDEYDRESRDNVTEGDDTPRKYFFSSFITELHLINF